MPEIKHNESLQKEINNWQECLKKIHDADKVEPLGMAKTECGEKVFLNGYSFAITDYYRHKKFVVTINNVGLDQTRYERLSKKLHE